MPVSINRGVRPVRALVISTLLCLLVAAPSVGQPEGRGAGPNVPQFPQRTLPPQGPMGPGGSATQPGAGGDQQSAGMAESASGITLNFVNADVRDVAKAVLGDYLKLNYEISANTAGMVTIQTSKPLDRSQVLPALEQALGLAGLALVHSNGIYEVLPL